jgi:hypothetical protein
VEEFRPALERIDRTTVMRDAKAIAKTKERDTRTVIALSALVLLTVVVLIPSIAGAAAPV